MFHFLLNIVVKNKLYPFEIHRVCHTNVLINSIIGIYDIDELLAKYKSSAYSNYLTFICHTCRKLIDIQDFYRDIELDRIINK